MALGVSMASVLNRAWASQFRNEIAQAEEYRQQDDEDADPSLQAENRVRHRRVRMFLSCTASVDK
jgi:hypothetical protein